MNLLVPFFTFSLISDPEQLLVERLRRRETDAVADLYDRYKRLIYSVIFQAVRDQGIAEDLVQETFWRVWNRIESFNPEKGKLEGWLATIARNRAVDYLRSVRGAQQFSFESIENNTLTVATASPAGQVEREKAILRALQGLSPAQRQMIELAHYQGFTQTEIADKLKRPLGTVKGTLRSALKSLRAAMQGVEV